MISKSTTSRKRRRVESYSDRCARIDAQVEDSQGCSTRKDHRPPVEITANVSAHAKSKAASSPRIYCVATLDRCAKYSREN